MQKINSEEELEAKLKSHAAKLSRLIPKCTNEEQTKTSLINPYLEYLGWDVRDPDVVCLEYQADFDKKNPERVDYAIMQGNDVLILIEAKPAGTKLPLEVPPQLQRYFQAENSKYAILTNGVNWQWYRQDPDGNAGRLAKKPFLEHKATCVSGQEISWLWQIGPERFNPQDVELKAWQTDAQTRVQDWFKRNLQKPEEDFIKFLIRQTQVSKAATSSVVENMKKPVRDALNQMIQDRVNRRINLSLDQARPESGGMQDKDTPPTPIAAPAPEAAPEASKPEPLENPYIPDWLPVTEWKKFQLQGPVGRGRPKIRMTLRLPDSPDRECAGFTTLAKLLIDWIDSRFQSAPILENRLIHIPGSTMVFANTEPRYGPGKEFRKVYHAKNLGMYFELNLNSGNLMSAAIALLEKFRIDPQQVMIRSSRGTGERNRQRN